MIETLRTGVGAGLEHAEQGVAGLVVGGAAAFLGGHDHVALRAELDLLQRVGEVVLGDDVAAAAGRGQRGLVREVGQVRPGHARGGAGDLLEVDVGGERDVAGVHLEDLGAAVLVGRIHEDRAVEPAGSQQRRVEHVRAVGGGQHDHALGAGEAVHLGEDLVERLLTLVVTADGLGAGAGAADGVDLVDEDDGRATRTVSGSTGARLALPTPNSPPAPAFCCRRKIHQ